MDAHPCEPQIRVGRVEEWRNGGRMDFSVFFLFLLCLQEVGEVGRREGCCLLSNCISTGDGGRLFHDALKTLMWESMFQESIHFLIHTFSKAFRA